MGSFFFLSFFLFLVLLPLFTNSSNFYMPHFPQLWVKKKKKNVDIGAAILLGKSDVISGGAGRGGKKNLLEKKVCPIFQV